MSSGTADPEVCPSEGATGAEGDQVGEGGAEAAATGELRCPRRRRREEGGGEEAEPSSASPSSEWDEEEGEEEWEDAFSEEVDPDWEEMMEWELGETSDREGETDDSDEPHFLLPGSILRLSMFTKLSDIQPEPFEADVATKVERDSDFKYCPPQAMRQSVNESGEGKRLAPRRSLSHLLRWREAGVPRQSMSAAQRCHITNRFIPSKPCRIVEHLRGRAYIGQFSPDGTIFVAASQENQICLYDVDNNFRLRKDIVARNLRWTVTDTCLSPDQRLLIYASITPSVHVVNVGSRFDSLYSIANVTDIHEELRLDEDEDIGFGIWSVRWSSDGRELVAGTNDHSLILYDVEAERATSRLQAHIDDVNAVAFLDESCNLILTGSDDELCKVWDKRCMRSGRRPQGVLVGHTQGITHIDPKGDGRHFISNSKDQSIKLWDTRKMYSDSEFRRLPVPRDFPQVRGWDYRWMEYPARGYDLKHPQDVSLKTYHGHNVASTLIRCYFSPAFSTGQRYIYTGSRDGSIHIYDLLTGEQVASLDYHEHVVRDCSWHPTLPSLCSVSWDGSVVQWSVDGVQGFKWDSRDEIPLINCRSLASQPGRRGFV